MFTIAFVCTKFFSISVCLFGYNLFIFIKNHLTFYLSAIFYISLIVYFVGRNWVHVNLYFKIFSLTFMARVFLKKKLLIKLLQIYTITRHRFWKFPRNKKIFKNSTFSYHFSEIVWGKGLQIPRAIRFSVQVYIYLFWL